MRPLLRRMSTVPTRTPRCAVTCVETIIQQDEGKRGLASIFLKGELYNAASALLKSKNVAIITGFPCLLDFEVKTETDGPLGAMAIARSLIALGKTAIVLTDECNEEVMLACAASSGIRSENLVLESFPGRGEGFDESDIERLASVAAKIDTVVAIERAGPSSSGACLTMSKRDMTPIISPLEFLMDKEFVRTSKAVVELAGEGTDGAASGGVGDDAETPEEVAAAMRAAGYEFGLAFGSEDEEGGGVGAATATATSTSAVSAAPTVPIAASTTPATVSALDPETEVVTTIGIGDGGNEVGMGKVFDRVVACASIANGADIACVVPADHLIVASVSNWGGHALAAALAVLAAEGVNASTGSTVGHTYPLFPQYFSRPGAVGAAGAESDDEEDDEVEMNTYEYRVLRVKKLQEKKERKEARQREREAAAAAGNTVFGFGAGATASISDYVNLCMATVEEEKAMISAMNAAGARDGILKTFDCYVDGMPFQVSLDVMENIRNAAITGELPPSLRSGSSNGEAAV